MPQVYTPLIYTLALLANLGWPASTTNDHVMTATFAGGSFWSMEAVQVRFNPKTVTYTKLLDAYWRHIDPTQEDGQLSDLGPQFRPVIYYADAIQRQQVMDSKQRLEKKHRYEKNADRFRLYTKMSGREKFLRKIWNAAPAR